MEFKSTLVREKFVIRDFDTPDDDNALVALSNRMALDLISPGGKEREHFVVRAQNMHTCVRMAAMVIREFSDRGPIMSRQRKYYWQDGWRDVTKGYEKDWNPNIWGVVYHKGRVVFEDGEHHAFLDIIEQCDAKNNGAYTATTIEFAQEAFRQAGKDVVIDYDSNIALVVSYQDDEAKCGVILRAANKTTTFNFAARPRKGGPKVQMSQSLTVSAAFLEGIQLAFQVGLYNRKKAVGLIEKYSDDDKKGQRSTERLASLNRAISHYEQLYDVHFRPEKPSFPRAVADAEEAAQAILAPQIQEMIERGELNSGEWVE